MEYGDKKHTRPVHTSDGSVSELDGCCLFRLWPEERREGFC